MLLKVGEKAPAFSLPDADMETVDLGSYHGKNHIVLFFYAKDGTPCCTKEATDFSDHEEDFHKEDCVLFGISRDECLKHAEFRDKEGIGTELLSDAEGVVCKQYGVWQERASATILITTIGSVVTVSLTLYLLKLSPLAAQLPP